MGGTTSEERKDGATASSRAVRAVGLSMGAVGCLMVGVVCASAWKVTQTALTTSREGLWKTCVEERATGQTRCRRYDGSNALPPDLHGARAAILASLFAGVSAAALSVAEGGWMDFVDKKLSKAGALFVASGLLCLVPVCWSVDEPATLSVGWAAAALLLTGGSLLHWNCCHNKDHHHHDECTPVRSSVSSATTSSLEYTIAGGGGSVGVERANGDREVRGSISPLVTVEVSLWWYDLWWKARKPA